MANKKGKKDVVRKAVKAKKGSAVIKQVKNVSGKERELAKLEDIADSFSLIERLRVEKESWVRGKPRTVAKEALKLWLTIPPLLRGRNEEVIMLMGITDPDVLALVTIRTQRELATFLGVNETVVSEWMGLVPLEKHAFKSTKMWFRKFSQNVLATLYRKSITEGDAPHIKLYLQVIEDWKEQFGVEHSGGVEYNLEPEEKAALDKLLATNAQ